MVAVIQLAEQPQGSQRRLQLMRNVRGQVTGALCLQAVAFLHGFQAVLHLHGGVFHLRDRIRPQGQGQFSPVPGQVVFHPLRKGFQAFCLQQPVNQRGRGNQQEDSNEDVSDH